MATSANTKALSVAKEQASRSARLFLFTLLAQPAAESVLSGNGTDKAALVAALVAAAEVAYRQFRPVIPAEVRLIADLIISGQLEKAAKAAKKTKKAAKKA